uniref:Uncharacterized protein n=1 Tax=Megaselia scalaris TaxID=36166 RepID=T1GRC3_MEGSC
MDDDDEEEQLITSRFKHHFSNQPQTTCDLFLKACFLNSTRPVALKLSTKASRFSPPQTSEAPHP